MARPWISCNLAISADGKISSTGHRPATWTSASDHQRLLQLREPAQALMVGRGTWETDRMTMTIPGDSPQPLRCIVSRHGGLSAQHPIFAKPGGPIHLLVTEEPRMAQDLPATIHCMCLEEFLKHLCQDHHVHHLHCEGGGQLIRALAALDAIDEIHLTLAGHTVLGGHPSPTLTGVPGEFFGSSQPYALSHFESVAETGECFLSYRRQRAQ